MKVRIEREVKLDGKCFFYLYADGKYVTNEPFKLNEPDESIYNEKKAYDSIYALAKDIEANGTPELIRTVYETPEPENERVTTGIDLAKIDMP